MSPLAAARPAGAKGTGIFAISAIPAGTTVAAFGGYAVDRATLQTLDDDIRAHAIQIDDELFLASLPPYAPADHVNHSCEPNCGIVGSCLLVTMRDVSSGEELCFDYAMSDTDPYDEFVCACGTPSCRGRVSGNDWRRPELQARYEGYFSAYIARRLARLMP